MSNADLIDGHVSSQQCKKAVDALLGHALQVQKKKDENELLPGKEQHVWLVVAVKKMQPEKKLKPFKIPIKHPLVDPRTTPVCLITKDPQREYKDLLESHGIKFVSRVVGITKLKGKFKPFEARRMLLQENGLFLADERVVPLLPGLLGKRFFEAKKQPIPVCLTRKDLKGELERAISSTYMHQNQGTCTSVKVGTLSQKPSQILDNLKTALPAIIKRIKGEWDNIQSLNIKTSASVSLPIWSCDLGAEEGARWDGFVAGEDSEEDEMEVEEPSPSPQNKGKKRAAEPQPAEESQRKTKKAKADGVSKSAVETDKPAPEGKRAAAAEKTKKAKTSSHSGEPASSDDAYLSLTTPVTKKHGKDKVKEKPKESLTPAAIPGADGAPAIAAQTASTAAGGKKAKRKAKQGVADAHGVLAPTSIPDIPASDSITIAPASGAEGDVESAAEATTKRRKKKKAGAAAGESNIDEVNAAPEAPAAQDADPATSKPRKERKPKRQLRSGQGDSAESATGPAGNPESAIPATTVATPIADKKRTRALAVHFFDPDTPTTTSVPAAPVNTSATPGDLDTPAKKKKRKKTSAPVDAPKLAEALVEAKVSDPEPEVISVSKAPESDAQPADPTPGKRKKRNKGKKVDDEMVAAENEGGPGVAEPEKATITQEEVKQKRKERKKEKVTKGKPGKSAKEDIVGKKASLS